MSFEPLLTLTQTGPKVTESSAKVYRDGLTMRLSGDLIRKATGGTKVEALKFYPWINRHTKVLQLKLTNAEQQVTVMRGWYSSKGKSLSMLVSIRPVMEVLGMSVGDTPGEYVAKASKGLIEVYFNRRVNEGNNEYSSGKDEGIKEAKFGIQTEGNSQGDRVLGKKTTSKGSRTK